MKLSDPNSEDVPRLDLANCAIDLADASFLAPARAALANVSPASIANGQPTCEIFFASGGRSTP
jgi:hypothetical protein